MRLVPSTVPNAVVKAVPLHIVPDLAPMLVASSTRSLERLLERHEIDTSEWKTGKAKSIENLFGEMQRGEAVLRIDSSGALCRCLNVVKVLILPDLNFSRQNASSLTQSGLARRCACVDPRTRTSTWSRRCRYGLTGGRRSVAAS